MPPTEPLVDAVVLELGQVIAGTLAGALLADMGATVIKVEPLSGDAARNASIAPIRGYSGLHLTFNRGKKSVALDLKKPEGLQVFYQLARHADVVIDNFRPGVMARLGIDYTTLAHHNPRIITCSVTGYGQTGPWKDRAAFDLAVQAISGHMSITGQPDGPPCRVGIPLADIAGAIFASLGVLAALHHRERTGRGCEIDVSMFDCMLSLLTYDATVYLNTGREPTRLGSAHAFMVPWQAFATQDGHIAVAVREEKFWERLCDAVGLSQLKKDPRFTTNAARLQHRWELEALLQEQLSRRTTAEWMELFEQADIPAAPVNTVAEALNSPHARARGILKEYDHPVLGLIRYVGSPLRVLGWEHGTTPAPEVGEHTVEVLSWLGYAPEEIRTMVEQGAVGCPPASQPAASR